jgi:hypothetical protein
MTGNPVRFGRGWFRSAIAPWEAFAIGFTLLFKSFQRELVPIIPVHHVCMTFGVIDHKRWSLIKKYTNLCREAADNSAVDTIDLEETAARLPHGNPPRARGRCHERDCASPRAKAHGY